MNQKTVLHNIWEEARLHPHKVCIFEKEREITYGEHKRAITRGALFLKNQGIKKGDKVAVIAEQTIRFIVMVSAIHLVGGVVIPLEKKLPEKKISEILKKLDVIWLLADENILIPDINVIANNKFEKTIVENGIGEVQEIQLPEPQDMADILFTTGTTGNPKGIEVTHLANRAIAENVIDSVELQEDDIELIPTPINHSLGLRRYYGAMYRGSTIGIIDGVIYMEDFFEILKKKKVTAVTLVPTMLSILLKFSGKRLGEFNEQLRFIQLGSAPIAKGDREKICNLLPDVRLYNTYGATEAGCTCILDFNNIRDKAFCIGRLTINSKLIFVDDDGNEMVTSKDRVGRMVFEGPMVMKGYCKDPELTKEVLRDGRIYTNDIGYIGEDGYVYLLGRKDDVINSGGNKIAPLEIEETTLKLDKIEECACIPVDDLVAGQIPKLFVVMKQGETFNQQEILSYLAERLENFKIPKYIEVLDKLPRAYNGKILKKELKEREQK